MVGLYDSFDGEKYRYSRFKLLLQTKGVKIVDTESLHSISHLNITNINGNKVTFKVHLGHINVYIYTYYNSFDGVALSTVGAGLFKCIETGTYLSIDKKPKSYNKMINGKMFNEVASIYVNKHMPLTVTNFCSYFKENKQCMFCAINHWSDADSKNVVDKIEAIKVALKEHEVEHISITTGTLESEDRGLRGIFSLVKRIRKAGIVIPIAVECEPTSQTQILNKLYELGVTTISCNLEFFDDDIRLRMMPAKGKLEFEKYTDFYKKCISIFGRNQVYTNILWSSYDSFNDLVRSRINQLTHIGVIPSIGVLYSEKKSQLADIEMPDLNEMFELHIYNLNQLKLNNLNPLKALAGCPRNSSYSCINEFYTAA